MGFWERIERTSDMGVNRKLLLAVGVVLCVFASGMLIGAVLHIFI